MPRKPSCSSADEKQAELLRALDDVRSDLTAARSAFAEAREPELIEAAVFEINALEARYRFALRQLRELDVRSPLRFRPAKPGPKPGGELS